MSVRRIVDAPIMINFVAAETIAAVTVRQLVQARDGTTEQRLSDISELHKAALASLKGDTVRQRKSHPKAILASTARVTSGLGSWAGYCGKPGPRVMGIGLANFQAIICGTNVHDLCIRQTILVEGEIAGYNVTRPLA